jgi:hypothetical protein
MMTKKSYLILDFGEMIFHQIMDSHEMKKNNFA